MDAELPIQALVLSTWSGIGSRPHSKGETQWDIHDVRDRGDSTFALYFDFI